MLATLVAVAAGVPSASGSSHHAPVHAVRAPNTAPLTGGSAASNPEATVTTMEGQADPLVSNGLGSPTCRGGLAGELASASKHNCETSDFVAAGAPTGDFGLDVHIDTGFLSIGSGFLDNIIQDVVITPLWMAIVWAIHALVVMLEWSFTLDLINSSATVGLGGGLRAMQRSFTEPWLAIVLACASVLAAYRGLIRRRVADTLGEALLMGAMMAAGLAVIAAPAATVGALGEWADEASLGTLAAAAHGSPAHPANALADSLSTLFATAVEAPWCYLEFGQVDWCREPSRLDPRLHTAALALAAQESRTLVCQPESLVPLPCAPKGSGQAKAIQQSVTLLRAARSNGAIFLALPANGPARNSINESSSLLHVLCQSSEANNCRGPTAAEAEFRTSGGTLARLGGLVLIVSGLLGMLLLLGFLSVRLLIAAVFSLLYLLLAPAVVLAPAFGESGRAVFRKWGAQLLGAVVSKLVFAFLLGVVLAVLGILYKLTALGWWTQWLLTSAFWWGAFKRRHQLLAPTNTTSGAERTIRRSLARRVGESFDTPRRGIAAARRAKEKFRKEAPAEHERKQAILGRERAKAMAAEHVKRTLEHEYEDAQSYAARAPELQHQLAAKRQQLSRLSDARAEALASGDTRRAARLGVREGRVRSEIEREQQALRAAQNTVRDGQQAYRRTGDLYTPERAQAQERFLAEQAQLPARGRAGAAGERRDYAALAGLAGYGREEYERLDSRRQRTVRAEIDRELALHNELGRTLGGHSEPDPAERLTGRERRRTGRQLDGLTRQRMRERGHAMPVSSQPRSAVDRWREAAHGESSVMRDAREVAARRKRQLGEGRP